MPLAGFSVGDVDKLKDYARRRRRIAVIWDGSFYPLYPHLSSAGEVDFTINDLKDQYYIAYLATDGRKMLKLLFDFLRKFGHRFCTEEEEVAWRISAQLLITAVNVLNRSPEQFEELTRTAKTQKDFIALAVVV